MNKILPLADLLRLVRGLYNEGKLSKGEQDSIIHYLRSVDLK